MHTDRSNLPGLSNPPGKGHREPSTTSTSTCDANSTDNEALNDGATSMGPEDKQLANKMCHSIWLSHKSATCEAEERAGLTSAGASGLCSPVLPTLVSPDMLADMCFWPSLATVLVVRSPSLRLADSEVSLLPMMWPRQ